MLKNDEVCTYNSGGKHNGKINNLCFLTSFGRFVKLNANSNDEQQIECDKVEFEFVPNAIQQHIIMYFCGNDLACSLTLTAPMEIDIEEISYENNLLTFSGIILDR